jgi:hypothetical protein
MTTTQNTITEAHVAVCERIAEFAQISPNQIEPVALEAARDCYLNPDRYDARQQQLARMLYRTFTFDGWIDANDPRYQYLTSRVIDLLGPTYFPHR